MKDDRVSPREWLLAPVAASAAVVYFLLLGGTPAGEQIAALRSANTLIGALLIGYLVLRGPRFTDAVDRLVVGALVLVAASAVVSPFPRQAVDALIAMLAYAALFLVARELMVRPPWLRGVIFAMRAISVAVVVVAALRLVPAAVEWWQLTGDIPPLRLPLFAGQWGHAYDLLLLGVMLSPSWFVAPRSRILVALGAIIAVLAIGVVLLKGPRAIWLALAFATMLGAALPAWDLVRRAPRRLLVLSACLVVAAAVVAALAGGPIVERVTTFATVDQRVEMWTAATDAWVQSPLLGFGPNTFPWILQSTDYFDANSIHARHPDSAVFQLIPEMGLVGIVAATVIVLAIGVPLVRNRRYLALWPLTAFVTAGIAANPTDFAYLVVVAILWAAYGLPRQTEEAAVQPARWLRPMMATGFALVGVFVAAALVAGVAYDDAKRAAESGDFVTAREALDTAAGLDPSMAIYWRQRGIANLLLGETEGAVADLERARSINSQDDVTWRVLGIARWEHGDAVGAKDAFEHAVELQRSDPTNVLLLAAWHAGAGDTEALGATAAEVALGWPTVLGAPGWADLTESVGPATVIEDALERWQDGQPSGEPIRQQPLLLAALAERDDLIEPAAELTNESVALAEATVAVFRCDRSAGAMLEAIPASDRRSNTFWELRIQEASQDGRSDPTAVRLYRLITAEDPKPDDWGKPMNPLHENNPQGSVDAWGYDRSPIAWPESPISLPSPSAGTSRWLLDPSAARAEAGVEIPACR